MKKFLLVLAMLTLSLVLLACAGGTVPQAAEGEPEVVERQVTVIVTVEGEEEVRTETIVVTATPEPVEPVSFTSPDPDTLVNADIGEPEGLDPRLNYETSGNEVIDNVYDRLITYNREQPTEFVPSLASEWEVSEDGTVYTFTLRDGITFHNGNELTAEDVAYTFQSGLLQGGSASPQWLLTEPFFGVGVHDVAELLDPETVDDPAAVQAFDPARLAEVCEQVKSAIVANEDGTVTMNLAVPWGPFLPTIAGTWGSIIDQEWAVENGAWDGDCATWQNFYGVTSENNPLNAIANGTGPYMLESWTPGEQIVLVANPDYWVTEETGPLWEGGPVGPPAIERVVIETVDEWGTRFAMLQAGDADFAYVPPENWSQLEPLVGEICTFEEDGSATCEPSENPDAPLRVYRELPSISRTDGFFTWNINTEGGNNFIGSGQLDGNGIPPDFFTDEHVRKAFNYCFDWETFIADVYQGEAVQNVGILIPGMLGYEEDGPVYSYDPEQCAAELEQAWDGQVAENGFRMQVAYNTGNTTRQTMAEILQANLAAIDERYQIETVALPWPNFLRNQRESRLPMFFSGWVEDIHDPHNWAQPFTVGTYGGRQGIPEEVLAQFGELVNAGIAATDEEERAEIYQQLQQLDYDVAPAIRGVIELERQYEQRWVDGYYYNPIAPGYYYYPLAEQGE